MKTTGDQQLVKRINRSVLLRLLRAQPGLSRARLAAESGLTKSTVSLLVRELLLDGWLTEAVETVNEGLGRPSTPLHIHEGNFARYQVRPSQFTAWHKVWTARPEKPAPLDIPRPKPTSKRKS